MYYFRNQNFKVWQGNDHKYRVLINLIKTHKEIAEQFVFLNKRSQPLFVEILPSI